MEGLPRRSRTLGVHPWKLCMALATPDSLTPGGGPPLPHGSDIMVFCLSIGPE